MDACLDTGVSVSVNLDSSGRCSGQEQMEERMEAMIRGRLKTTIAGWRCLEEDDVPT